ncbi:MAG TPA: hypothetical protein VK888_05675 [Anaerolineales bacterium]|nr:hypothetical protein [Anaerolineales bacterium]
MSNEIKIATIRGAGLAFPIACLWYVYSGHLSVFSLVLFGAGAGFLVGLLLRKHPVLPHGSPVSRLPVQSRPEGRSRLMSYLSHSNPIVRFGSLLGLGASLFLLAWCIGYFLLPEGIFHGGADVDMLRKQLAAPSVSVFEEWTRIFRANLFAVLIILLGSLLMRVNGLSFGYLVALFNLIGYGLFIGTNSFAIPYPQRMAPSFEILGRGGPYEMIALVLIASATYFWSLFEIKRLFITNPERIRQRGPFSWMDGVGVGLGLVILACANWIEAMMVMSG